MSSACLDPISWEVLVDYWADGLAPDEVDQVDEHLMGCGTCSASSARIGAIAQAVRALIPPIVSREQLEVLRARGLRIAENPFSPGQRKQAVFASETDLLVHRLGGLDLARADNVRVIVRVEETGEVLADDPNAPFDRDAGEVIIACQRHYAAYPRNIVFEVRARGPSGSEQVAAYAIPHVFES